ncbi:MBL fold metallo-hydrolase [Rhizobium mongolense]|uniref:MBL fold metallo-hydrolase n=1 Tax=Rhizobium TaxID=379 RepID=UPI0024B11FE6|nr:MBL fold metallo-hydrolase [Rhizobium sp. CC1099]WFU90195.1 MBL fold metallo-hydrolase [Rhizobium sp. CC1099]
MLVLDRRSFLTSAALGTAAAGLGRSEHASAADSELPAEAPGFYSLKVGEFRIAPVCDGVFHLPMNSIATNAEPAARKAYFDAQYMTADVFQLQVNPLLIDTAEKLVLVDTGVGPGQDWAPTAGRLAKSLQNAGVAPADIDVIVLTHCHVDHVGGLEAAVSEGFSKAEVVLSETELDLWNSPDAASKVPDWAAPGVPALQKTFATLGDRLRPVKGGTEIVSGVMALDTPGHTPGHMSVLVASGDVTMLVTGDALANIHFAFDHPDWQMIWDHDRELGVQTRKSLLDRATHDRLLVTGYHYPFPGVGHVVKDGDGFRWLPANWVWDSAT